MDEHGQAGRCRSRPAASSDMSVDLLEALCKLCCDKKDAMPTVHSLPARIPVKPHIPLPSLNHSPSVYRILRVDPSSLPA